LRRDRDIDFSDVLAELTLAPEDFRPCAADDNSFYMSRAISAAEFNDAIAKLDFGFAR
jgi:hypothetical protein